MHCQQNTHDHNCLQHNTHHDRPNTRSQKFRCQFHAETYYDQNDCCQSCSQNVFHTCVDSTCRTCQNKLDHTGQSCNDTEYARNKRRCLHSADRKLLHIDLLTIFYLSEHSHIDAEAKQKTCNIQHSDLGKILRSAKAGI